MSKILEKLSGRQLTTIVITLIIVMGSVINPSIAGQLLGFGRDAVRTEIEEYLDQGLGGSPWQTEKPYTYGVGMILVDVTKYAYMISGASGKLMDYSDDHEVVFNWAIANLTSGGKIFVRAATYDMGQITDQGNDDIELHLEEGAILKAETNHNDDVILLTSVDGWWIHGGEIDGNKANQDGTPNGLQINCIRTDLANDLKFSDIYIHDAKQTGLFVQQGTDIEICGLRLIDNAWNGLTIGIDTTFVDVHDCYVHGSSDVGISVYGSHITVHDNLVQDMDGNDGAVDGHWGIGLEGTSQGDGCDVFICNNVIENSAGEEAIFGYCGANYFTNVVIKDNLIETGSEAAIGFTSGITDFKISGNHIIGMANGKIGVLFQDTGTEDGLVSDNYFDSASGYYGVAAIYGGELDNSMISGNLFDGTPTCGIFLDAGSDENSVVGNRFLGGTTGLQIDDAAGDNNRVDGNDFWDTTTDVVDNGTGTLWGRNIDQSGTWVEGSEP